MSWLGHTPLTDGAKEPPFQAGGGVQRAPVWGRAQPEHPGCETLRTRPRVPVVASRLQAPAPEGRHHPQVSLQRGRLPRLSPSHLASGVSRIGRNRDPDGGHTRLFTEVIGESTKKMWLLSKQTPECCGGEDWKGTGHFMVRVSKRLPRLPSHAPH